MMSGIVPENDIDETQAQRTHNNMFQIPDIHTSDTVLLKNKNVKDLRKLNNMKNKNKTHNFSTVQYRFLCSNTQHDTHT